MCRRRFPARVVWWAAALLLPAAPAGLADPPKDPAAKVNLDDFLLPDPDVEWLKRAKVPTDDAGLLQFLKSCQGPETPPAEIDALLGKLMAGTPAEQTEVARKLTEIGTIAVPALRRHRTGPDAEAARRVRDCLQQIEEAGDRPLARPAMRRLLIRRPPGTAEALLGYLPFASDPAAEEDVYYGLDELTEKDSKVLQSLAAALKDPQPARRAVAAGILGRRGDAGQKAAVRELLKDSDSLVRLRAAQGLLAGRDKGGMPTLIELLDDPSVEVRWQAEELLRWTAIDTAPAELTGPDDPAARRACRAAWRKWWAEYGEKLNLAAVEKEPRRPLLLLGCNRQAGRVWIFGSDGATRHEWATKKGLEDIQYVPGGTVLTLHEQPVREKSLLAERDWGGAVIWQHDDMADPKYCQRLSNGRMFVAEYMDIAEPYLRYQVLSAAGKVVGTRPERVSSLRAAHALRMTPDGKVLCLWLWDTNSFHKLYEYDTATDSFHEIVIDGQRVEGKFYCEPTLDRGYLLTGLRSAGAPSDPLGIVEFDQFGAIIWKYILGGASHATRLRGGTTVACAPGRIVELSPDRRMVGEINAAAPPDVARPILSLVRFGFDRFPTDFDLETDIDYRVRSLKRKDARARIFALKRLAEFGPTAGGVLPKLKALETVPDPAVRAAVRKAQLALGIEEIPRLLAEAKHADPGQRTAALHQIRAYYRVPAVVDALVAALGDENVGVRTAAGVGLGGEEHPNPQRRITAFESRGRHSWAADKIVPALIRCASTDKDEIVRRFAMNSLGDLRGRSERAVPLLITKLKDDGESVSDRITAAHVLGRIGRVSPDVEPALHAILSDPKTNPRVRCAAAFGLRYIQPASAETIRRLRAAYAAEGIREAELVQQMRYECRVALSAVKAYDRETIEFYKKIVKDPSENPSIRYSAIGALLERGALGAGAIPLANELTESLLNDEPKENRARRRHTANVLRRDLDQYRQKLSAEHWKKN